MIQMFEMSEELGESGLGEKKNVLFWERRCIAQEQNKFLTCYQRSFPVKIIIQHVY